MVHPAAWNADAEERQGPIAEAGPCRFCGLAAPGWTEPFLLNGDPVDRSPDNLVTACALCQLVRLDRPFIDDEATIVWLPEMTQATVNALVRETHRVFHAHGEPPTMERRPLTDTASLRAAYVSYQTLAERGAAAKARLGSTSPVDLGAALLALSPKAYAGRANLLGGVRLLGRGRFFRSGADVYPQLLDALPSP
jgi:hypothetical protein